MKFFFFLFPMLFAITYASPTQLEQRNACDMKGVEPVLYKKYGIDACPPKYKTSKDGSCPVDLKKLQGGEQRCVGFCEKTTEYKYGREQIFLANPYCHGPMSCSISDTTTVAVGITFSSSLNLKFNDVLGGGISGGVSKTKSVARAQSKSIALKEGECGYFSFIPIIKKTCGVFTEAGFRKSGITSSCDLGNVQNKNACAEQTTKRPGYDEPNGDTIFVRVDCANRKPLPSDKQDPAYRHDDVPLKREQFDALAKFFDGGERLKSDIDCSTTDKSPKMADCAAALKSLEKFAADSVQIGKKGRKYWASYSHSCALQIEYEQDWPKDACGMKWSEVATQAAGMFDKCAEKKTGKVGALRKLKADGKCNASLRVTKTEGGPPLPISG